jgi:hypothetical protein
LLPGGQRGFQFAQAYDDVAAVAALHDGGDYIVFPGDIFVVQAVAFGFAYFLQNDLLGGLRGDTAKVSGCYGDINEIPQIILCVNITGFLQGYVQNGVFDGFGYGF